MFIERTWRSLKYERVYLHAVENGLQAGQIIAAWMAHNNQSRLHFTFDGQTLVNQKTFPQFKFLDFSGRGLWQFLEDDPGWAFEMCQMFPTEYD